VVQSLVAIKYTQAHEPLLISCTAINHRALTFNPDVFGSNPLLYDPDRWFNKTPQEHGNMERGVFAFGQGKRMCLGIYLAYAEMLKLMASLLVTFEVSNT
jgi:cytochrome P450